MFYLWRFCRPTFCISDNKFCLCCYGNCLQRKMNIYFSYLLCLLLFSFIRCRKKVMQVLFCDLHSAVVLADNVWSSRQNYRPCVMVHRFRRPILSGNSTTPTVDMFLCFYGSQCTYIYVCVGREVGERWNCGFFCVFPRPALSCTRFTCLMFT